MKNERTWTIFRDMHSGGDLKLEYEFILVDLPEPQAVVWFEQRFHRWPYNVTCNCCGEDYSASQGTFQEISEYHVKNDPGFWAREYVLKVETDK